MAYFYLIRHASNDSLGRFLAGRKPGVHLNEKGKDQVRRLAGALKRAGIQALYSSPLERALETAHPIAETLELEVRVRQEINEVDFGQWTGRPFDELSDSPVWRSFNNFRSGTRIPGGELILEVQNRVVSLIEEIRAETPDDVVALVSHGDVIKAAMMYYAGMPLDLIMRLSVDPCSVSVLSRNDWGARIIALNRICGDSM